MTRRTLAALSLAAALATAGCSAGDDEAPMPTVTTTSPITAEPTDEPPTKAERIAAAENAPGKDDADDAADAAETAKLLEQIAAADAQKAAEAQAAADAAAAAGSLDLSTDAGLCAADAELTSLELNDALAPLLGFPADRDLRTPTQDDAIRTHKTDAFTRACPERA